MAIQQGVQRRTLLDLGNLGGEMEDAVKLPVRQGVDRRSPRKQPTLWSRHLPPLPQHVEQVRRQHHIAILVAVTLLNADYHLGAVDIGDLERHHFRGAQARP